MASAASTIASLQLKGSFVASPSSRGLVTPKGISGTPLRVLPSSRRTSSFTIKAIQSEKPTYQVIQPINGGPFIGILETPITSSPLIAWYLSNLPAYSTLWSAGSRSDWPTGTSSWDRSSRQAHSGTPRMQGTLAAAGLVVILSICLTIYGISSFKEGEPSTAPSLTLTGRKKQPGQLQTA